MKAYAIETRSLLKDTVLMNQMDIISVLFYIYSNILPKIHRILSNKPGYKTRDYKLEDTVILDHINIWESSQGSKELKSFSKEIFM